MLKKSNRLASFKKEAGAMVYSSPFLTISATKADGESKFAFIISKKIDKRAVIRNRIKRKMSRFIEENLSNVSKGFKVVIITKRQILEKELEISQILEEGFLKLKLFK